MAFSAAKRLWIVPDCPPAMAAKSPYPNGIAVVVGGTVENIPPVAFAQSLTATYAISPEAAATACVRWVSAFLWTVFYDPTGQADPAPMLEEDPE